MAYSSNTNNSWPVAYLASELPGARGKVDAKTETETIRLVL